MPRTSGADARLMARLREADPAAASAAGQAAVDERAEADLRAVLAGEVTPSAVPRHARAPRRALVLGAAAAAVVVAVGVGVRAAQLGQDDDGGALPSFGAAGSPDDGLAAPAPDGASASSLPPAPDAETLLRAVGGAAGLYDYAAAATPAQLAVNADLVAVGSVVDVTPEGPAADCDGPGGLSAGSPEVLVSLDHLLVAKGQPDGASVEVAVPLGGEEALPAALPLGTRVLVFASPGEAADCSPVYRVTEPQGLAIQAAGGQVVWPVLGEVRNGVLAQALPGGTLIAP